MDEVESKLIEETDYELEVQRSIEISQACAHIPNIYFPTYYPDMSAQRVITMDWLEGQHIKEFLATNPSQKIRNKIGQAMWEFYHHQVHNLKEVHADPHPGNFILTLEGVLGIIDFGCVKTIPDDFYNAYFKLMSKELVTTDDELIPILYDLNFLYADDTDAEKEVFIGIFKEMTTLLGMPFHVNEFDFADDSYFRKIYDLSERLSKMKELRQSKHPRGSKHGLYVNRTYFGLYTLLNQLGARITTTKPDWLN